MTDRVTHWYRKNAASRLPRRVITLDSEAYSEFDGLRQSQTFRLAVACLDVLDNDAAPTEVPEWFSTLSTGDLWKWVAAETRPRLRTVVFAHNLSYDIRITEALKHLPELGFKVHQIALSDYGCWVFLRNGERSLYLVDSHSHIPAGMDKIATLINARRPKLPDQSDDNKTWEVRCRVDVQVLRDCMLTYLSMLRKYDLGDFRTTGAGQSSAAFRHRFLRERTLLVHSDAEALSAERKACWAGRSEVWRHGFVDGPLYEYDYDAAYARIAKEAMLPVRLVGEFFPTTDEQRAELADRYALLIQAKVRVKHPTLPTEDSKRIAWPVGEFVTTVWDCELDTARDDGLGIEYQRVWAYERGPLLKEWANWILDCLAGKDLGSTDLGKLIAKDWSRSLIGRFGLRYPLLSREGDIPKSDLLLRPVVDIDTGHSYMQLQVGTTLYEQTERIESPNSCPAIMGYVMALARCKIWRTMKQAGLENLVSVDTDGLIVAETGRRWLELGIANGDLPGLRLKATYANGTFRGPRNMDLGETRRVSGVPRKAERLAPGVYRGEVWESLPTALRQRRPSQVFVHERTFNVSDRDPRRVHLDDGRTCALTV